MDNAGRLLSKDFVLIMCNLLVKLSIESLILNEIITKPFYLRGKIIITDIDFSHNKDKLTLTRKEGVGSKLYLFTIINCDVFYKGMVDIDQSVISLIEAINKKIQPNNLNMGNVKINTRLILLTDREKRVISELCKGKKPKEIAINDNSKIKTIYSHKRNALKKLGFRNFNDYIRHIYRCRLDENNIDKC